MRKLQVVVIGGGYAGILAAVRAAKLGKEAAEVILINDRDDFVERIRLHEHAVHGRGIRWPIVDLLQGSRVNFRRECVTDIEPSRRRVRLSEGEMRYDKLVIAVGSVTDISHRPAGARENAQTLDPGTSESLGGRLRELSSAGGRVTVCGGGLVGVELASEIAEAFPSLAVTLMTSGEVAPLILPGARVVLRRLLAEANVGLHEHTTVSAIEKTRVLAEMPIDHDLCITAAGMRAPPLIERSGLVTNSHGQALVDPFLRCLGRADVYAVGDAGVPLVVPGSPIAMGCKYGLPMAAQAAWNATADIAGHDPRFFDYDDTHFAISVGRKNGLVQLTRPGIVLTGRLAATIKEIICRSTVWAMRWERHRWFSYPYMRTGRAQGFTSPPAPGQAGAPEAHG